MLSHSLLPFSHSLFLSLSLSIGVALSVLVLFVRALNCDALICCCAFRNTHTHRHGHMHRYTYSLCIVYIYFYSFRLLLSHIPHILYLSENVRCLFVFVSMLASLFFFVSVFVYCSQTPTPVSAMRLSFLRAQKRKNSNKN